MILLLWIALVVLTVVLGAGGMTIVYGKRTEQRISFSDSYLLGWIFCIGMGEVAHVVGLLGGLSLTQTGLLLRIATIVAVVLALLVLIRGILKKKERYTLRLRGEKVSNFLPLSFLGLFFVQALLIYCREPLVTAGDITLETVQSFLAQDGIYRVLPLTGMVSEQGMPLRYTILGLPTMYAALSQMFGVEPLLLICHIIPIVVLGVANLAYYRLSSALFGEKKLRQRFLFLLLVALILLFSDNAVYLDGYSALHGGYTGVAIRNLVLVPYTLCAALERRWWKAILCILAEACITWTLLGCGVCVIVLLGILLLQLLEKWVPGLRKILQFFRNKEELV